MLRWTILALAAIGGAAAAQPTFRATVDVVSLDVTATDAARRYVPDLGAGDFQVLEDGRPQRITVFSHANPPIAFALLLDTSASMHLKLATARMAASGFVTRLRAADVAEMIGFNSRVNVLQPFTAQPDDLDAAIGKTVAGGSTSMYDALYVAIRTLAKTPRPGDIRRRVVIMVSDGEDTSSLITYDELLDAAKRSDTVVYAIGFNTNDIPDRSRRASEARFSLRQLADVTGGRAFWPASTADLKPIYDEIATELANQYVLGYVSSNTRRDGAWRRISVRVNRPDVIARTRAGYFAARRPTP